MRRGMKLLHEDAQLVAFADALGRGALPAFKKVVVDVRHEDHPQLIAACQPRGIEHRV